MNVALPSRRMSNDEFLAWSEAQVSGKYELLDGIVIMQQNQRWAHVVAKTTIFDALRAAIKQSGVSYFAVPDGQGVRIREGRTFEPDALVAPLPTPAPDALSIDDPIIVVEVLSPSTAQFDVTTKLRDYFLVPSIQHYLVVDPDGRTITHHKRTGGPALETRIVDGGTLQLDPPGIAIDVGAVFAETGMA